MARSMPLKPSFCCMDNRRGVTCIAKMVPVLAARGIRVIAPDHIGMGKSDKPIALSEHTYLKHVDRLKEFIRQVVPTVEKMPAVNLFVQDWGSLFGLRVVGEEPDWFRRVIVANGNLPVPPAGFSNPVTPATPVNYNCSDSNRTFVDMTLERFSSSPCGSDQSCFGVWVDWTLTNPTWQPSEVLDFATVSELTANELAAYNAPFAASRIHSSAIRAFPSMIAAVEEPEFGNTAAWESLQQFPRPFLALAGEQDQSLGSEQVQNNFVENVVGASVHNFEHRRYPNANHFIQEDVGPEMAAYVADFIEQTSWMIGNETTSENPTMAPTNDASGGVALYQSICFLPLGFTLLLAWFLGRYNKY